MRLALVFGPLVVLAAFVALRALIGRPLSRRALDVTIALVLLAYLAITAGLGLFWVARMDLPVFDWHYLFGYALLLVAAAHVSLQVPALLRFFRRRTGPGVTPPSGPRRPQATRGMPTALAGVVLLLGIAVLLGRSPGAFPPPPAAGDTRSPSHDATEIVARLHGDSSYSRRGVLRSVGVLPARPAETKPYPGRARARLPAAARHAGVTLAEAIRALASRPAGPGRTLTLDALSALLFHGYGVTASGPGYALRAAASSGALYPTDLYVVSDAIAGLEPGAHYYDSLAHELVGIGDPAVLARVREALPDLPGLAEAPVLLVLGSTFDRTTWKYTVRSYRYLGLDAGHVAGNLVPAAAALGAACDPVAAFDDARLGAALGLDPAAEAPLLVLACGGPSLRTSPATSPRHEVAPWPDNAASVELTRLSSAVTSWKLSPGFHWLTATAAPRERGVLPLAPSAPSQADLFEVIRSRRSVREFAPRPLSQAALSSVLAEAQAGLGWLRGVALVELHVAVRAVSGLEPGTYRYDPEARALSAPIARGAPAIEAAGLDQALLGGAAVVLAWSLIDERVGRTEGARDYRHANLEAGLAGELVYLSATARGLGTCGVGAFYDDEVARLFSSGARAPRVIYLQGLGER